MPPSLNVIGEQMSFTIVVPFYNGHKYLKRLLNSIPESIPVILVDDQSESPLDVDGPNIRILRLFKKGYFTGASNRGIEACKDDVLILNQDTYFTSDDWLNFIEQHKKKCALFGERAGSHPAWPNRYIHGTFMYVRRDVIDTIGLMNEENYPHWGSTCEYQLRACRKGFKALPIKKGEIPGFVHLRRGPYGSATRQALAQNKTSLLIKTPPYISVIITCYNYGRYLQDAVNSLIGGKTSMGQTEGQTFQGFEIVIVDDGSTDGSAKIGRKLANPWQGIHFVRQDNAGSAAAMNAGIMASHARSGHLIAPLDGDDMMKPERLERMARTYENNPHSVIYDNLQYFAHGQEGVVIDWQTGKRYETLDLGNYDFEQIINKNTMHKGLMYPRQAWEEVGGYPEVMDRGREDWAFNVGLGIKGWCGINTGAFDYLYRREGQNRTLTNTTPRHRSQFHSQLRSIYPDIYRGERPVGCCGGGKISNNAQRASATMAKRDLPGKTGMVILEYNGGNKGDETWGGPVTRTKYVLGGVRKRGYVDVRDANGTPGKNDGMLNYIENDRPIFKVVKPDVEEKPKSEPVVEIKEPVVIDKPDDLELPDDKYAKLSVSALKKALPDMNTMELSSTLQQEKDGKNRKSAIAAIENEINDRLA